MTPLDADKGLTGGSHKQVSVTCDFGISEKCRKTWMSDWRMILRYRKNNDGKDICLYCSRYLKLRGRRNPNCHYANIDDSLMDSIDTEGKAYLLGWIASDGSVRPDGSISISIHRKDRSVLTQLRSIVGDGRIFRHKDTPGQSPTIELRFCSKEMAQSICHHLGIAPGKKSGIVKYPGHLPEQLQWAFIRGFFDGDGSIRLPSCERSPDCNIATQSPDMRAGIIAFAGGRESRAQDQILWGGSTALDFLGKLYDKANFYLSRKRDLYIDWCQWKPAGKGNRSRCGALKYNKLYPTAQSLIKHHVSDSGYDIAIIGISKIVGDVTIYSTGIRVQPPDGYYFDLVPRSSIIKTGYELANSVGVIDRTYVGEILVALRKVDQLAPDLPLPSRVVQLIPRAIAHFDIIEVTELDDTARGAGGFGSTGI